MNTNRIFTTALFLFLIIGSSLHSQTCSVFNLGDDESQVAILLLSGPYADTYVLSEPGEFSQNEGDGTAHLTGTVARLSDPEQTFELDIYFVNGSDWEEWSAMGRGYKDEPGVVLDNYLDYTYYEMDGSNSALIGTNANTGIQLDLAHAPVNFYYGFQVGLGANASSAVQGLGGWFRYSSVAGDGQGDILLEGDCQIGVFDCPDLNANVGDSCDDDDPDTIADSVNEECICVGEQFYPAPENDDICNAIPIEITLCSEATVNFSVSLAGATADGPAGSCWEDEGGPSVENDIWFAVVVPSTGELGVLAEEPNTGPDINPQLAIYESNAGCDGVLQEIACNEDYTGDSYWSTISINGLTPGDIVFVQLDSQNGNPGPVNMTFCSPEYDCQELLADMGASCDDGDDTTYDDTVNETCECVGMPYDCPEILANVGGSCDDGDELTFADTATEDCDCVGSLYDCLTLLANIGDSCDDGDPNTIDDSVSGVCLCAGELLVAPENDEICNAIPVNISLCSELEVSITATLEGATPDGPAGSCWEDTGGASVENDIWFAVVVPNSGIVNVYADGYCFACAKTNPQLALYQSDNGCQGELEEIACNETATNSWPYSNILANGLTPGDTVHVQVDSWNGRNGALTVTFCSPVFDCPAFLADFGSDCDDGNDLTYDDIVSDACECVGTLYDCPELLANVDGNCDDGDDLTYADTANEDCECIGTLYDCPTLFNNIGEPCNDESSETIGENITEECVCEGQLLSASVNDDICNAILTNVYSCTDSVVFIPVTLNGATADGPPGSCWEEVLGASVENDVWFAVVVPSSGILMIMARELYDGSYSSPLTNPQLALYQSNTGCDGLLEEIACNEEWSNAWYRSRILVNGLIPGDTLFVQLDSYNGNPGLVEMILCSPEFDCPELLAYFGSNCDDGNDMTYGDIVNENCECVGYDCPVFMLNIGDSCDDSYPDTFDDVLTEDCQCIGSVDPNSCGPGLEDVIVEVYYVTNAEDSIGSQEGGLAEGATTYRVFLDLAPGYLLETVYGSPGNELMFSTSSEFYNHPFGASIGTNLVPFFLSEDAYALDSWVTFGGVSSDYFGILKDLDMDGSVVGGVNNNQGILINDDPSAGLPLTQADGLLAGEPQSIISIGDFSSLLNTYFGNQKAIDTLYTENGAYAILGGVGGSNEENQILIAQVTTNGIFEFRINFRLGQMQGDGGSVDYLHTISGDYVGTVPYFTCDQLIYSSEEGVQNTNSSPNTVFSLLQTAVIEAFPNPSDGEALGLVLSGMPAIGEEVRIYVTDVFGRKVLSNRFVNHDRTVQRNLKFPVSLENGFYLLSVEFEGSELVKKIMVTD